MYSGILLNAIISIIVSLTSFAVSFYIYRKSDNNKVNLSFAAFWYCSCISWLAVAFGLILFGLNYARLDLLINQYGVQTLIFLQITACTYYGFYRVFKSKKIASLAFFVYIIFSIIALFFEYQSGGIILKESNFFSVEYTINPITLNIFQAMMIVGFAILVFDLFKIIINWAIKKQIFESRYFLASLSVLVYGIAGFFDNRGTSVAWTVVLTRLIMVGISLIAYLAFSNDWEIFIDNKERERTKIRISIFQKFLLAKIIVGIIPVIIFSILLLTSYQQIINTYTPVLQAYPDLIRKAEVNYENIKIITFLIFLLVAIFVIFLSIVLSRKFLSPINNLIEGTKKIKSGDLNCRIEVSSHDEFVDLADSFNQMANNLKSSYQTLREAKDLLEKKVKERTKELEVLNQGLATKVKEKTEELQKKVDDLEKFKDLAIGRELKMIELKQAIKKLEKQQSGKKAK